MGRNYLRLIASACLLLALASCTGRAATDASAGPFGLPWPPDRTAQLVTVDTLLGREAELASPAAVIDGDSLILDANSGIPLFAAYRYTPNPDPAAVHTLAVHLAAPDTSEVYLAVPNYTLEKWEFSGPFTPPIAELPPISNLDNISLNGNLWLAVITAPGEQARIDWVGLNTYVNQPPQAVLQADVTAGTPALTVTFDASLSTSGDPEGTLELYEWDLDGDGSFEESGTVTEAVHVYQEFGEVTARLRVTDDGGLQSTDELLIQLGMPAIPDIFASPAHKLAAAAVNGCPALGFSSNGHVYFIRANDAAGTSWATSVKLTDGDGFIGLVSFDLAVVGGVPTAAIIDNSGLTLKRGLDQHGTGWESSVVRPADTYRTDLSLAQVDGTTAICFVEKPLASQNGDIVYLRATDPDATTWASPVDLGDGNLAVAPSLCVINGNPAVAFHSFGDIHYRRAADSQGAAWNDSQIIHSITELAYGVHCSLALINGKPAVGFLDTNDLVYLRATDATGTAWDDAQFLVLDAGWLNAISLAEAAPGPAIASHTALLILAQDTEGAMWDAPLDTGLGASVELLALNGGLMYFKVDEGNCLRYWFKP